MSTKKEMKKAVKKSGSRKMVTITNGVEYFKHEEGENVSGFFIEMLEKKDNFNEGKMQQYAVVESEADSKQIAMPSSKVLNDFFLKCKKGRFVSITYKGKKLKAGQTKLNKKGNNAYHDYLIEAEDEG